MAPSIADLASTYSPPTNILIARLPTSPLFYLIDEKEESLPSNKNLVPHKRRLVDIGDRVVRAADSTMDDFIIRKMATIILEYNVELASDVPASVEVVEGVPLPFWW